MLVNSYGKDLSKSLLVLLDESTDVSAGEKTIVSLWKRGNMWPHAQQTEYWETICWMALVHGFRHDDSYMVWYCLLQLAEYGFNYDSTWSSDHHIAGFEIDPTLWECIETEFYELGSGPGFAAVSNIRKNITGEVSP